VYYQGRSKPENGCPIPIKHFFWCSSTNFTFSALPQASAECVAKLGNLDYLFSGEFDTVLVESTEAPKVIDAAAGIILPPKHFTELDRLAVVVSQINEACSCVPKGAMKCIPTQEVLVNEGFCGLSPEDAICLSNWQHLRSIRQEDKKSLVARAVHVYNDDFLDGLECDKPRESWSLLKDVTGGQVTLRSQLWPGFYAYHRCNTPVFGAVYIGDGIQNASLPFML
jgi:hypothetical protein